MQWEVSTVSTRAGRRPALGRVLIGLMLFSVSFGFIEATVVVYLRTIYEPMRQQLHPGREPRDLFPLLKLSDLQAAGDFHVQRLKNEVVREVATLVLLASAATLVGRNFYEWFAAFILSFGLWDIFFYVFLKVLVDWPVSLMTWDILFLIPVPWVGPVLTPVLVAASMVVAGVLILWRESVGRPIRLNAGHWVMAILGGTITIVAFCWDYRHTMAGGYPQTFNWPLFVIGLSLGWAGFALGWRTSKSPVAEAATMPA